MRKNLHNPNDFFIGDHVLISYPEHKLAASGIIDGIRIGDAGENSVELRFAGYFFYFNLLEAEVDKV